MRVETSWLPIVKVYHRLVNEVNELAFELSYDLLRELQLFCHVGMSVHLGLRSGIGEDFMFAQKTDHLSFPFK